LYQIAEDVNLKFGSDSPEAKQIIEQLIANEHACYENFVELNPDILLPTDLEISSVQNLDPVNGVEAGENVDNCNASPDETFKASVISPPGLRW
jgi:hypothetical protein